MCGIAGIYDARGTAGGASLLAMTRALRHRGPDDEGYCFFDGAGSKARSYGGEDSAPGLNLPHVSTAGPGRLALGHRRLSIVDLSSAGHQPMTDAAGEMWIVYNGEVYNHVELRAALSARGHAFRTGTDTEVILAAYKEWGEACLDRFVGMWGFALWDAPRRRLFCARDRFGVKPFYYTLEGPIFRFASEIKALLAGGAARGVDEAVLFRYLAHNQHDDGEATMFSGVRQLPAGHFLVLEAREGAAPALSTKRYWTFGAAAPSTDSFESSAVRFRELLEDAVRLHLRGDRRVGTCLSGGLDSSSIACLVNGVLRAGGADGAAIGDRQKTFSARFREPGHDEGEYIQEVLAATGADGKSVFPALEGFLQDMPRLIHQQDQPFGAAAIYSQWCVFRLAAESGIKVVLDGQGGDELLAGYPFMHAYHHLDLLRGGRWGALAAAWRDHTRLYSGSQGRTLFGLANAAGTLWFNGAREALKTLAGRAPWLDTGFVQARGSHRSTVGWTGRDALSRRAYAGIAEDLPTLLRYEDRNSMAFSVESRVPFLDHRLAEFAAALPSEHVIRGGAAKAVLREALRGVLPEKIRTRTGKMGFTAPDAAWFRQGLLPLLREKIAAGLLARAPYFDRKGLLAVMARAEAGALSEMGYADLWRVLNALCWIEVFGLNGAGAPGAVA